MDLCLVYQVLSAWLLPVDSLLRTIVDEIDGGAGLEQLVDFTSICLLFNWFTACVHKL